MGKSSILNVLIVDDDQVDIMMIKEALAELAGQVEVLVANDGLEALEILRGSNGRRLRQPSLVLLDLNMPRMSGIEFLREVRGDEDLRHLVIFMLSTSNHDQDKLNAYRYQIAGYLVKSDLGPDFQHLAAFLKAYRDLVRLPATAPVTVQNN